MDELIHPAGAREYSLRQLLLDVPRSVDIVVFSIYPQAGEKVEKEGFEVDTFFAVGSPLESSFAIGLQDFKKEVVAHSQAIMNRMSSMRESYDKVPTVCQSRKEGLEDRKQGLQDILPLYA